MSINMLKKLFESDKIKIYMSRFISLTVKEGLKKYICVIP